MNWGMAMGGGWDMVDAALVLGLFWAVLVHPERIRHRLQFRIATVLLGLGMVLPLVGQYFVADLQYGTMATNPNYGLSVFMASLSPIVKMFVIILAVGAVMPPAKPKG